MGADVAGGVYRSSGASLIGCRAVIRTGGIDCRAARKQRVVGGRPR